MAKKRFFVLAALLALTAGVVGAQSLKSYYDWDTGYSGHAVAVYQGTTRTLDVNSVAVQKKNQLVSGGARVLRETTKLSKEEIFLIGSALWEYDVSDGEIYYVCVQVSGHTDALAIPLVITGGGKSFTAYSPSFYFTN